MTYEKLKKYLIILAVFSYFITPIYAVSDLLEDGNSSEEEQIVAEGEESSGNSESENIITLNNENAGTENTDGTGTDQSGEGGSVESPDPVNENGSGSDDENNNDNASDTYICGLIEHQHSAECFNEMNEPVCSIPEHVHSDACKEGPVIVPDEKPSAEPTPDASEPTPETTPEPDVTPEPTGKPEEEDDSDEPESTAYVYSGPRFALANYGLSDSDIVLADTPENILNALLNKDMLGSCTVALIDSGSGSSPNVVKAVSLIDDDPAGSGHAQATVNAIVEENPAASILTIKAFDENGQGAMEAVAAAITYAAANHPQVICLPFYAYAYDDYSAVDAAIQSAISQGITVIAAAGRGGYDVNYIYPAAFSGVYIATSVDSNGQLISNVNYGSVVNYYVESGSTDEAAARVSGYLTKPEDVSPINHKNITDYYSYIPESNIPDQSGTSWDGGSSYYPSSRYYYPGTAYNYDKDSASKDDKDKDDEQDEEPSDFKLYMIRNDDDSVTLDWSEIESESEIFKGFYSTDNKKWKPIAFHSDIEDSGVTVLCVVDGNETASIKDWLENELDPLTSEYYGFGLINVLEVSIDDFNAGLHDYINKDENGLWNIPVIMLAGSGKSDLSDEVNQTLKEFISDGNSVIINSSCLNPENKNTKDIAESYLPVTVQKKTYSSINSIIKVAGKSSYNSYPWDIGVEGSTYSIKSTGSANFVLSDDPETAGNVIMKAGSNNKSIQNIYSLAKENVSLIQLGDINQTVTSEEKRVLANMIFNSYQSTVQTVAATHTLMDQNSPAKPTVKLKYADNILDVNLNSHDNGSNVSIKIQSFNSKTGKKNGESNTVTDEFTSGLKGYYFLLSHSDEAADINDAEFTSETSIKLNVTNQNNKYLHVWAIDNAGNLSEETIVEIFETLAIHFDESGSVASAKYKIEVTDGQNSLINVTSANQSDNVVLEKQDDNSYLLEMTPNSEIKVNVPLNSSIKVIPVDQNGLNKTLMIDKNNKSSKTEDDSIVYKMNEDKEAEIQYLSLVKADISSSIIRNLSTIDYLVTFISLCSLFGLLYVIRSFAEKRKNMKYNSEKA